MDRSISARRVATLVGDFDRGPAYAGLADALVLLIGDGRIPVGTRLPSERELTEALGVSRTTVTRAYATVRDAGYADARQGSGTYTQVPGGPSRAHDRALLPGQSDRAAIDLNCAAPFAPPEIATAYAEAASRLPAYLGGHGYFPAGLPELQAAIARLYDTRGVPTDPAQIMVTPGALSGVSIVAQAIAGRGDRVLVDSPGYPNAAERIRSAGARLATTEVDPDGWDLDATATRLRQVAPRLAYLIPDFQNPTGLLMTDEERERYAGELRRGHVTPVVDESHAMLALEGQQMPRPFAAYTSATITVGSVSKAFWGGLRVGWVRAPLDQMDRLTAARVTLDLGVPVMEQLATLRLLEDPEPALDRHRARLREQRDALAAAVTAALPGWRFRVPAGGLSLWCELPGPGRGLGVAVAEEAERHGVIVAPGPVFAPEGGLDRFVRIPFTRRVDELEQAVAGIAAAWEVVSARRPGAGRSSGRVMVA
jgi:DNA-binding transcriptional MocR family regulator